MNDQDLTSKAADLTRSVNGLAESVDALTREQHQLTNYSKRSRKLIWWTVAGLAVDLILTVVITLLYDNQRNVNQRQRRIQTQVTEVLHSDCPFFKDLGTVTLPKQASVFGIKIVADSRNAYYTHGCVKVSGKLGKPEPRLLPYLLPEAK